MSAAPHDLESWIDQAWAIHGRRPSAQKYAAAARHAAALDPAWITTELDLGTLEALLWLIACCPAHTFGRPCRGYRETHWTTAAVMHARNQIDRLARIPRRNARAA